MAAMLEVGWVMLKGWPIPGYELEVIWKSKGHVSWGMKAILAPARITNFKDVLIIILPFISTCSNFPLCGFCIFIFLRLILECARSFIFVDVFLWCLYLFMFFFNYLFSYVSLFWVLN